MQKKQDISVLQTNGSGVLSFSSPSADFVLLATTDASSSSSVSFDGYFSATYKNYKIFFSNSIPSTDDVGFLLRVRKSNADITSANYRYSKTTAQSYSGSASINNAGEFDVTSISCTYHSVSSTTGNGGISGEIVIYNPLNTSSKKSLILTCGLPTTTFNSSNEYIALSASVYDDNSALSGITFYFSSGNIASGTFKLYGLK